MKTQKDPEKTAEKHEEKAEQKQEIREQEQVLLKKITQLEDALQVEKSGRLSALADLQNYRRRMEAEKQDLFKVANKILLQELIETVDDCQRAIFHEHQPDSKDNPDRSKSEGVQLIMDKLMKLLEKFRISKKEVKVGEKFDPVWMEAIGTVTLPETEQEKNNTVVHVDRSAFVDKESGELFRSAKVIIGKYHP